MNCEEKRRLATEYEATTPKFSKAVAEPRKKTGTSANEEYKRFERAANEARVKSEQARLALEQHVSAHGCYTIRLAPPTMTHETAISDALRIRINLAGVIPLNYQIH
jgi:hypothetical protein